LVVLALGLVMFAWLGRSQPVVGGQGFKFTEYYDPPHETQLKSLLEGARAQRLPDGRIQVTDAKYRTYRVTGEGEMTVEAPECFYNSGQRSISSSGPLHVKTADGKFSIEGEGFLWQQTNSTLLVSNRVHTIIHPEQSGPPAATATTNVAAEQTPPTAKQAPGIDIFSDQFEYAQNSGLGVYRGNVRVAGTNLNSTAGKMTMVLSAAERRLQTLEAEENVIINYEKIHATAGQALYSADTGLIQLTNQPTWRLEQRDGSGDELVFDQTNRIFRANGHARLNMPAQNMGVSGFLSRPGSVSSNSVPTTNHFVEVLCDNYELQTNLAVFRQDVRVSDRVADQLQGEMNCALLTLSFSGTNELRKMLAERQVVIAQQDKQFTAEKAEYTGTNGVLDLTGNPAWRAGLREGKGDLVRVHLAREEMLVSGNAVMKLPAAELGQSAFTALGNPKPGESKATTNEFAEVYSQQYFLTPESALFRGNVRIEHPQMKWTCPEITMLSLPELGKAGRLVIAEPAVVFDVRDDQGRSFHGTGDKAVYTHRVTATLTNDIMELTGNPAMLEATNLVGRNKVITLDLASHKVAAPGKYKLWAAAPEGAPTTFRPPKTGLTR
jgi:lipopolysaccharide export system protein LptA